MLASRAVPAYRPHCHSPPSVPVALPLAPERSNTVRSTSSGSVRRTATRPRAFRCGTLGIEWQCTELCPVRSTSSGSVRSAARYAHPRVAVWGALPLAPQRTGRTATRPRAFQHGTLTAEWQCTAYCHSPLNVSSCTFIPDWQCEMHCRAPLEVLLVCSARLPGPH